MYANNAVLNQPLIDIKIPLMGLNYISLEIHRRNIIAGWWTDRFTGEPSDRNVPEMLCLVHSEISEAMEGYRKNLRDDKLPQYDMFDVELADTLIRIFDLAGAKGIDLAAIIRDKLEYNANREDHKPENRIKDGGKAF